MNTDVSIKKGQVLIYRVFDIAEEVDLQHAEGILSHKSGESRVRISKRRSEAIIIRNAPIRVHLGDVELNIAGNKYRADTVATVWDYGAMSVCLQINLADTPWNSLLPFSADLSNNNQCIDELDDIAHIKSRELVTMIHAALKKPNESKIVEDYVMYFLEQLDGIKSAQEVMDRLDLPAVILGETVEKLSDETRKSIVENIYQYASNDFVLIDWNSAIILEPTGGRETVDVLEFALTHLLEVRYYDDLLDKRLSELYDSIEAGRQRIWNRQFDQLSKDASTKYLEFTEFMERIENSLKVVGDFYLARIFRAAMRRFRVPDWQSSITRKMNLMARVSELLMGEVNVRRSHLLELIVILLIAFEIISTAVRTAMSSH